MSLRSKWRLACLVTFAIFLCAPCVARAQPPTPKKRLRAPATVRSLVGGESTDRYVIRARKGQTMTVRISWKKEKDFDNSASFSISSESEITATLPGQDSDGGKRWTGKIPRTGDYLIEVVAHPHAHYTLRVTVR
jgi:hypothetical protein